MVICLAVPNEGRPYDGESDSDSEEQDTLPIGIPQEQERVESLFMRSSDQDPLFSLGNDQDPFKGL